LDDVFEEEPSPVNKADHHAKEMKQAIKSGTMSPSMVSSMVSPLDSITKL